MEKETKNEKLKALGAFAFIVLTLFAMGSEPSHADSTVQDGKASGTTDITFTMPDTGQLTLDKVPSYSFGQNVISGNMSKFNTTGDNPYTATNLTGSDAGYTVMAQASPLKNNDNVLPVSDLLVTAADGTADPTTKGQLTGASNVNIYNAANKVANGNANSNGTLSSGATSAVMDLSTINGIKTGQYKGTIDYTITNGIN